MHFTNNRYCASCMTGKKVRVFWPVDSQWYIAHVQKYDIHSGEHLLRYPDGDTEWVRIGEDHTTNHTQYKEYYNSRNHPLPQLPNTLNPIQHDPLPPYPHNQYHASTTAATAEANNSASADANNSSNLTRLPSLGNGGGMSFALSNMSQSSFGLHSVAEDSNDDEGDDVVLDGSEKTMQVKPSSSSQQQQEQHHHHHHHHRLYQQLNLDHTASSMSSFGMFGGGEIDARQPSFVSQHPPPPPPHGGGDGECGVRGAPNNYQILPPNFTHSFSSKIGTVPSMEFFPPPPPHTHHPHHHADGRGEPYPHAPPHPPRNHQQHQHHRHQQQQREGEGERTNNIWPPNHPYPNDAYYDERGHHPVMYPYQGVQQQYQIPNPKSGHSSNTTTTTTTSISSTSQPPKRRPQSELSPSKSSSKNNIKTIGMGVTTTASNPGGLSAKTRKALPTAWAPAEDEHLLDLVLQMQHPLKWSVIAESLSSMMANKDSRLSPRTGKQCRERVSTYI